MFLLPERAEQPAEITELPVEARQHIGALRLSSLGRHSGSTAILGSKFRGSGVVDTEVHQVEYSSRRTRGAEIYR